jgi:hypothetical protein
MLRILADHDVEGHVRALVRICSLPEWADTWASLACQVDSFEGMGIAHDTIDSEVWRLCQKESIVLVTGNRNAEDETSLEMTIRAFGTDKSLPVITISDPKRFLIDRAYAQAATAQFLQDLMDLEILRGTGRLFIP